LRVTDNGPARKSASGITLRIVNTDANLAQDQRQVDIAFGAFEKIPAGFGPRCYGTAAFTMIPVHRGRGPLSESRLSSGPKRPPATRTRATAGGGR
jgi:hypothetical protein